MQWRQCVSAKNYCRPEKNLVSTLVDALSLPYALDVDAAGQWLSYESVWPVVGYTLVWSGILANIAAGQLPFLLRRTIVWCNVNRSV